MFISLLCSTLLFAQSPPQESQKEALQTAQQERALALLETAKQLLKEAHYKQAIDAFQRVYELNKQAEIVEQIAVIQQRIGDYESAIVTLLKYQSLVSEDKHPTIQRRVANLRQLQKARNTPKKDEDTEAQEQANLPKEPAPWLRYTIWGVTGLGTASYLTFGLLKNQTSNQLKPLCANNVCNSQAEPLIAREKRYALYADVGLGVGLVGLGTSYYLSRKIGSPVSVGLHHIQWHSRF